MGVNTQERKPSNAFILLDFIMKTITVHNEIVYMRHIDCKGPHMHTNLCNRLTSRSAEKSSE
jgi:hypothetical protein